MESERENGEPRFGVLLTRVAAKELPADCLNAKVLRDARQFAQLQGCAIGARNTARLRPNETAGSRLRRRAKHSLNPDGQRVLNVRLVHSGSRRVAFETSLEGGHERRGIQGRIGGDTPEGLAYDARGLNLCPEK